QCCIPVKCQHDASNEENNAGSQCAARHPFWGNFQEQLIEPLAGENGHQQCPDGRKFGCSPEKMKAREKAIEQIMHWRGGPEHEDNYNKQQHDDSPAMMARPKNNS